MAIVISVFKPVTKNAKYSIYSIRRPERLLKLSGPESERFFEAGRLLNFHYSEQVVS